MKDWNNLKICRAATGWPFADIDQIDLPETVPAIERIVNYNLDAKALAEALSNAGIEVFCCHATSHSGNVWYDSKVARKFSFLGRRDLLRELTEECGKRGIDVTCLVQVVCNQRAHDEHPEWRQINSEGHCCDVSPRVCFNNPQYRAFFLKMIAEITAYDIKAILLDEFDFNGRLGGGLMCYCEHCRALFAEKFGGEMPRQPDWDNPQWIKFIRFRFDSLTALLRDVKECMKRTNPEVMLSIISYSGIWVDWKRLQPVEEFSKYLDFFCLDAEGILNSPILARFFNAYSREKAEIMGAATSTLGQLIKEPETELKNGMQSVCEIMTVLSHNLSWDMDIGYKPLPANSVLSKDILDFYSLGAREIEKRREWVSGHQESLAQIAIFYSESSKVFYGRDNVLLYGDEFLGYFEALLNAGQIFDLIGKKHLLRDGLKKYKLILLPGAACLSEEEVQAIREYVAGGGKILATYHTSLYDAFGGRRDDFALRDVFGCSYAGHIPEKDYRLRTDYVKLRNKELEYGFLKYASFDSEVAGYALPAPAVTVRNADAEIRGSLLRSKPGLKTYSPGFVNSVTFSDREETLITTRPFGKGQATYIGAKLGALYAEAAPGFVRKIMLEEMSRLLDGELDIEVRAPSSIEVTAFRQSENRIVIHLNNRQTAPDRFDLGYLLAPSLYEPQDMLPVRGVEVGVSKKLAGKLAKSYLAPEKIDLPAEEKEGKLLFRIPEIKYHSMLVLETSQRFPAE